MFVNSTPCALTKKAIVPSKVNVKLQSIPLLNNMMQTTTILLLKHLARGSEWKYVNGNIFLPRPWTNIVEQRD
jgi:hypothetical protein